MDERTDGWTDGRMDGPARARQKTLNGRNWLRLVRLLTIVALSSPSSATSNRASSYEKLQLLSVPRSNAAAIIVPLARASVSRSPSLPRRYFCSTCVEHVAHEHEYQYESLAERLARLGGFDLATPPGPEEDSSGMTRVFESSFLFSFLGGETFSVLPLLLIRRWIRFIDYFRVEDGGERFLCVGNEMRRLIIVEIKGG